MLPARAALTLGLLLNAALFDVAPPAPPALRRARARRGVPPAPAPPPPPPPHACAAPPPALLAAALAAARADEGAVLLAAPAGGAAAAGAGSAAAPLALAAGGDVCVLLLIQQPASVAVWEHRELDLPFVVPDDRFDEVPRAGTAPASDYPAAAGAPPDDFLLRVRARGGAEVDAGARLALLTPPGGAPGGGGGARPWPAAAAPLPAGAAWHAPPRFTAYAGAVAGAAFERARAAAGGGGGGGPLAGALAAHVERAAWTWNAGPSRTLHADRTRDPFPGEGDFDDLRGFERARAPRFAPADVEPLNFTLVGAPPPPPPLPPPAARAGAPACATADRGVWARAPSPGALARAPGGPWWRPDACDARAFSPAAVARCLARTPRALFLGDSHMRRHFKDLVGRSSKIADLRGALPPAPGASWWCVGREAEVDCACADATHRPTDIDNNPLTAFYKEHDTWWARGGEIALGPAAGAAPSPVLARADLRWWVGFLFPDWAEDLARTAAEAAAAAGAPDLVVFDLGAWDASFGNLARFEAELPGLARALAAAFPPPARLVYRTPTFFAGDDAVDGAGDGNKGRRWVSHGKLARMHAAARAHLEAAPELAGRLVVWDVWAVGEARPVAETRAQAAACVNGHEPSEDVSVENNILFNLLCDGEEGEGAAVV